MSMLFDYKPEDAFYGPLGELVKRIEPFVPNNILALYCELLVAVGTIIGRRAVIRYIEDEHFSNLFLIMVGKTGVGKGTSWSIIKRIATAIDPTFPSLVPTDSASAPGLIALVRDPSVKTVHGKTTKDEGVKDKRRLVLFEEMETLFTSMARQGSTLDQTWRLAWAGRSLENNAKVQERATDPHLSTVCQITPEAFNDALAQRGYRCLTNGFINRFLIVPVTKERRIHRGGPLPDVDDLVRPVRSSLESLGPAEPNAVPREIKWAPECDEEWDLFCDAIDDGDPYLEGVEAAYGRLKPMVMRVAMILAVIDGESLIHLGHLRAAKALCLRLLDASRHFFSSKTAPHGPTVRERLMTFRPEGSDFGLTEVHRWLENKIPRKQRLCAEELHALIDDFIAEGIWIAVSRTDSPNHRHWRFALGDGTGGEKPAEDEAAPIHSDGPEPQQPEKADRQPDTGRQDYYLGEPFQVLNPVQGLTLDDRPQAVKQGSLGYLLQLPTKCSGEMHEHLAALQGRKPNHRLVSIDGQLLLLPRKPVLEWARRAAC
jgi:hypothetical protein